MLLIGCQTAYLRKIQLIQYVAAHNLTSRQKSEHIIQFFAY